MLPRGMGALDPMLSNCKNRPSAVTCKAQGRMAPAPSPVGELARLERTLCPRARGGTFQIWKK